MPSALAVATFLAAVLAIFFREALFTERVLYFRDLFHLFVPTRRLITTLVLQGVAPWWNPYLFSGVPLAADVVQGVFYPPSVVFYFLSIHRALTVFVVGHYGLAGVAFYLLMRQWGIPPLAGTIGALTYMLSGYLLSLSNVPNFVPGATWLPLALAAFLRAVAPGGWRWVVPTGVVLALQAVTDPQNVYFSVYLMVLWVLLSGGPGIRGRLRALGTLGTAGATAALLAAVQLAPLLELYHYSVRSEGVPLQQSLEWSFHPLRLVEFLTPGLYGDVVDGTYWGWVFRPGSSENVVPWLLSPYVGIPSLVLAATAIAGWRDRRVRFCVAGGLGALILALGDATPLYALVYRTVPLFTLFRIPSKWLLPVTMALAALAGIGLVGLVERRPAHRESARRLLGLSLGVALLGTVGLWLLLRTDRIVATTFLTPYVAPSAMPAVAAYVRETLLTQGALALGFLVCTLLILSAHLAGRVSAVAAQVALLLLLAGDLIVHNARLVPLAPREVLDAEPPLARFLREDPDLFRIFRVETRGAQEFEWQQGAPFFSPVTYQWRRATLSLNTGMDHGLSEFWGSSAVRLTDYARVAELIGGTRFSVPLLGAWNVKYLVAPITELRHPLLEPVAVPEGDPRIHLYRNRAVLPRAVWVPGARWIPERDRLFEALFTFDPRREVLLEGSRDPIPPQPGLVGPARVEVPKYGPDDVIVRCTAPAPGFLVLADTYYPGWQVTVDGRAEPLLRANYAMRAVRLPAGAHEVRFRYDPWSVKAGGLVSVAALVVLGGMAGAAFSRRR